MLKSRRCELFDINIHRASYAKHLRSKKHLESIGQVEIIIPERLFKEKQTHIEKTIKKYINLNH